MTTPIELLKRDLTLAPRAWLVTGVAGFIGSHLLETLLGTGQRVVGLDNFSTGHRRNLDDVQGKVSAAQWSSFRFVEGDIRDLAMCHEVTRGVDHVLHQAALGSVPRSIADPITSHDSNVNGFLNMLVAARDAGVRSFIYAASSSTYGDHPGLPKVEDVIGQPLSPYAVTKYVNELYANVFGRVYGIRCVGLRYFNVFGPRQDPDGAYAAVIPRWASAMVRGQAVHINGDGETSRDFCYVANAVQANLLAADAAARLAQNEVFNVAVGQRTSLNRLHALLQDGLTRRLPTFNPMAAVHRDFRAGDVRHSLADIAKAGALIGYQPTHTIEQGLELAMDWYLGVA